MKIYLTENAFIIFTQVGGERLSVFIRKQVLRQIFGRIGRKTTCNKLS
jgi:hypothetical protein